MWREMFICLGRLVKCMGFEHFGGRLMCREGLDGLYSVDIFTQEVCTALVNEVENFERCGAFAAMHSDLILPYLHAASRKKKDGDLFGRTP